MARVQSGVTEIFPTDDSGAEDTGRGPCVTRKQASDESVSLMLNAVCQGDDGRSQWCWFRLCNGDLVFGCYPQGDTYEMVENDASF